MDIKKRQQRFRFTSIMISSVGILLVLVILFICVGDYPLAPAESLKILFGKIFGLSQTWTDMQENVVFGLRMPRITASVIVGAALSISGASYQSVFKNPLVSPDLLGVSAGASVGAAIAILLSFSSGMIQTFAFAGGIIAVLLTTTIPKFIKSQSNIMLVLSGIIVGGLMSSILGLLKYLADPETELASIVYWQMGSFSYIEFGALLPVLPTIIIPAIILIGLSWRINVLSLGEREAKTLGINITKFRGIALFCATLMTAGAVCVSGTIGWVGLVVPHFTRMITGPDNTRLIPLSIVLGGIFMLLADTVARTIGPLEMPISILTGIIGAPFYAWLLYRQRKNLV